VEESADPYLRLFGCMDIRPSSILKSLFGLIARLILGFALRDRQAADKPQSRGGERLRRRDLQADKFICRLRREARPFRKPVESARDLCFMAKIRASRIIGEKYRRTGTTQELPRKHRRAS